MRQYTPIFVGLLLFFLRIGYSIIGQIVFWRAVSVLSSFIVVCSIL